MEADHAPPKEQSPKLKSVPAVPDWQPFPLEVLLPVVRNYVAEAAASLGCDPAFIAVPLLAAVGAAIGNTRWVSLKKDWQEPPLIWAAVVSESGTLKTPAWKQATAPSRDRQRRAFAAYDQAKAHYEQDKKEDSEAKPPVCERCLVSDVTVESLVERLADAPRGLLLARDELSGWVKSFDQYRAKGRGSDRESFLSMWSAGEVVLDRKHGDRKTSFVPVAFLAITGGIQPGVMRRVMTAENFESGLAGRLLVTMPPRSLRVWSEKEIHPDTRKALDRLFEHLWDLEPQSGDDGPRPALVSFTPEGKQVWEHFYNEHGAEQYQLVGDLAAAWSKLEAYCARLALILHFCQASPGEQIEAATAKAAVRLVRWFAREVERVYAVLKSPADAEPVVAILALARRLEGSLTVRQLMRSSRDFDTAEKAEQALEELVRAGKMKRKPLPAPPTGGHAVVVYELC
jgi:hypothetical protein